MKTKVLKNNNLMNVMMAVLIVALVFFVIMGAFYFGALWGKNSGTSPNPVILPATNTPWIPWTETAVVIPTESAPPTSTPEPTATTQPTEAPTATPEPTATAIPTATPTPVPTDWAKFIKDIDVPNGTYFAPKQSFEKTWRIRNIGKTAWNKEYDLVFVGGTAMTDKTVIPLPTKVYIYETIDLTIKMVSPKTPGEYEGKWMLRSDDGKLFGLGPGAQQPLTVKIQVLNLNPDVAYDFILNMCQAEWWNGEMEKLHCPSELSNSRGFVSLLPSPNLESGSNDYPVIWVHPNDKVSGFIAGKYPAYTIQDGDHFRARVGVLSGNKGTKLTFKLQYQIGNEPKKLLGEWNQVYDGNVTKINLDLSPLAGQEVQFILRVVGENNEFDKHDGFWLTPRIENVD